MMLGVTATLLDEWSGILEAQFSQYMKRALRIDIRDDGTFDFIAIQLNRFDVCGYRAILADPEPGDVSISGRALDTLTRIPKRHGMMAMDIFEGPILSGLFDGFALTGVMQELISVHSPAAMAQLRRLVKVEP